VTSVLSGTKSCMRMISASAPPKSMKAKAAAKYQRPTIELLTSDNARHPLGLSQTFASCSVSARLSVI